MLRFLALVSNLSLLFPSSALFPLLALMSNLVCVTHSVSPLSHLSLAATSSQATFFFQPAPLFSPLLLHHSFSSPLPTSSDFKTYCFIIPGPFPFCFRALPLPHSKKGVQCVSQLHPLLPPLLEAALSLLFLSQPLPSVCLSAPFISQSPTWQPCSINKTGTS